jgi:hypothetical protein
MVGLERLERSVAMLTGVGTLRRGVGPFRAGGGSGAYRSCHDLEVEGRVRDLLNYSESDTGAYRYLGAIRRLKVRFIADELGEATRVRRFSRALITALKDLSKGPDEGRYRPTIEIITILSLVGRVAGLREVIKTKELPMWMRAMAAKEHMVCEFQKTNPLSPKEIKMVLDLSQDPDLAEVFREGSRYIVFGPFGGPVA